MFGTATFFDASQHITAGGSYRKYVGERGWGIEPDYAFMTDGSHQDHLLILNVVKDFTSPHRPWCHTWSWEAASISIVVSMVGMV